MGASEGGAGSALRNAGETADTRLGLVLEGKNVIKGFIGSNDNLEYRLIR